MTNPKKVRERVEAKISAHKSAIRWYCKQSSKTGAWDRLLEETRQKASDLLYLLNVDRLVRDYMKEYDTPVPDLMLRANLRKRLDAALKGESES